MEHRDYLKKQLDRFSRALALLLAELVKSKNGNNEISYERTTQRIEEITDLDVHELLEFDNGKLIAKLSDNEMSDESMEHMADIFLLIADNTETDEKRIQTMYERCYAIYSHLQTRNLSLERHMKIERLKTLIQSS